MELAQNDLPYQQAVEEARKDNKNQNWKNLPKGSFARSLQDNWAQTSVITNDITDDMLGCNGDAEGAKAKRVKLMQQAAGLVKKRIVKGRTSSRKSG